MYAVRMTYVDRVTIVPGKRGGEPRIRGLRITVGIPWEEVLSRIRSRR